MKIVQVALPVPLYRLFDYLLDDNQIAKIGVRVSVPFGRKTMVGVVVALKDHSDFPLEQLKKVQAVLDEESLYPKALWDLLHWGASYYQSPLGEVLLSALPVLIRQGRLAPRIEKILRFLTSEGRDALTGKLTIKQRGALESCGERGVEKENETFSSTIWKTLIQKGWVEEKTEIAPQEKWQDALKGNPLVNQERVLTLNTEQALAMGLLTSKTCYQTWVLEGVTGSGKTEVYLQFIAEVLAKGQQVLVLVPEIGLTPQTVQRFKERFNVAIDVLHSQLNDNERAKVWQRVRTEQTAILIGTRSALFTPFVNLGAIIIDEEHDRSFKQQDSWRYHGRDLAVLYAHLLNIPIILGSATPSLETLRNVQLGKYRTLTLKKRAGESLPVKHFVIDMKKQVLRHGLSLALINQMKAHLEAGNQVLLFLNRRGFSPVMLCHECGWVATCRHCEKPFTYHQHQRVLKCHHCGHQKPIPMQCSACGSTYLVNTGMGTEQLEANLQQLFPDIPIVRIDRDTTARKGALASKIDQVKTGQSQILIGTQMLAKGHHFPLVTLVGLLDVDGALFSTDFRAEEQLAQLYVQVAGRAGRGTQQGEVVLQTHFVDHPLLQDLLTKGYSDFAQKALNQRQAAGVPPFSFQALFKAQARNSDKAEQMLQRMAEYFRDLNVVGLQVLGAMPAPMAKKAGAYRWQLWLQHENRQVLQQVLKQFPKEQFLETQVRLTVDVDPLDFS